MTIHERIEEIKARADKATLGPWYVGSTQCDAVTIRQWLRTLTFDNWCYLALCGAILGFGLYWLPNGSYVIGVALGSFCCLLCSQLRR